MKTKSEKHLLRQCMVYFWDVGQEIKQHTVYDAVKIRERHSLTSELNRLSVELQRKKTEATVLSVLLGLNLMVVAFLLIRSWAQ